jgi:hypothetical protein
MRCQQRHPPDEFDWIQLKPDADRSWHRALEWLRINRTEQSATADDRADVRMLRSEHFGQFLDNRLAFLRRSFDALSAPGQQQIGAATQGIWVLWA